MKKIVILLSFLLLLSTYAKSQTFEFVRLSPKVITVDTSYHDVIVFHFKLKNTSSTAQNFKLIKAVKILPTDWTASICCKLGCMSSTLDTVPPTGFHYNLDAGETDSNVTMDISNAPNNMVGTATIVFRAYPESNPSNYIQDTCIANVVYTIGISQISSVVENYELKQNYPNPFNPSTTIEFSLQKNSQVNLVVYDMQGKEVAKLIDNKDFTQGKYRYDFNAGDFNLSSGVYFYKLITNDFTSVKKMLLIK